MDDNDKSKEELIYELQALKQDLEELRNRKSAEQKPENLSVQGFCTIEGPNSGAWDWDISTNNIIYSEQWESIFGYSTGPEMEGTFEEWRGRVHPDDLKMALDALDEHLKGGPGIYSCEYRLRCKGGVYKWVLDEGKAVMYDTLGNPLRFIGIQKDRTELKKTEFDLRERKKELKCHNRISTILGNPNLSKGDAIYQIVQTIPEAWQFPEITGASAQIDGQVFQTPGFIKTEYSLVQNIKAANKIVGQVEICCSCPKLLGPDEVFIPEEADLLFSIAERLGDFIDREEKGEALHKSEAKYRTLVENIDDVVYEVTNKGIIKYISPAIERMLGYTPEELTGKNISGLVVEADRQIMAERIASRVNLVSPFHEYRFVNKSGDIRWLRKSTKEVIENEEYISKIGVLADIGQQKLAEIQLQKSEALYRSILHASPDVITITDLEGKVVFSSPKAFKMFGYESTEVFAGHGMLEYIDPSDHQKAMEGIKGMMEGNIFVATEYKALKSDGSTFDIEVNGEFIRDVEGNPLQMIFVTRDITERKQTENKFRALFFDSPDGYLIVKDGRFIECNKASEALIGGDRSLILGKTPDELSPEYQPNGKKSAGYANELIQDALKNGGNSFEWAHKRFDGIVFLAQIKLSAIDYEGGRALLITWHDITQRREAEEKLRKLSGAVEQSPVSIVITNLDGNIEYANPKACETTGYTLKELLGKNPRLLKSGDTTLDEYSFLWDNIVNGKEWKGVFHNKRKNGELYWESSTIAPIMDASGKITHYMAIKEDITERRQVQLSLIKSEERFRRTAEASQTMIFETGPTGLYSYVSPVVSRIFGFDPVQVIGKVHFFDMLPEGYRDTAIAEYNSNKPVNQFVCPIYNKNNDLIWCEITGAPVFDEHNVFVGYRGGINDITKRKLAEDELKKFRTISDQSNHGNVISDLNGILLYSNAALARMHGYEVDDLIGKNLSIFHNSEQLPTVVSKIETLKTKGGFNAEEVWRIRKDGSVFPSLMNAKLIFDGNGQPLFMSASVIDITELKEAEEKIRQQNIRLNAIIEAMPDLIFVSDREGNYLEYFSPASEGLLYPKEKLVGANVRDVFDADTAELHIHKINECLEKKKLVSYEYSALKIGEQYFYEARIAYLDKDKVLRFVRDITNRKLQEMEIKKLNQAIEQSPVSIVITDLNANIQYVSPAFYNTTGYTVDDVLGKNTNLLKSGKTDKSVYLDMWETIGSGKPWQGEWVNKKKNGEFYWESVSITPILGTDDKMISYLAVKQDISQRKKAEQEIRDLNASLEIKIAQRTSELKDANDQLIKEIEERKQIEAALWAKTLELETFFNVSLDLICISDFSGKFIRINKAWEITMGYCVADIVGKQFPEYIHPDDLQKTYEAMGGLNEQNPFLNLVHRFKTKDGSFRLIEWHGSVSGNFIYAAARDITERKKAEDDLMMAHLAADKANLAKSEFLSRMSHELRTPMNSILGFAQLLEMGQLNTGQKKGVNHILRSGKHLLDLINEVLDISRIEAGRLSISMEPVQLSTVVPEMIDTVKPMAAERHITVDITNMPDSQLYVKTDRQRLTQILLNLLNNAIKYNKQGGSVWIKTETMPNKEGAISPVRISISDTGLGISPSDIPKLFIPFERIGAEKTLTEGTGLGLAVVKKLIDAMGGELGVESILGEGSTFWVELPGCEGQLEHIGKSGLLAENGLGLSVQKGTVLYIEDNPSNIELVEEIISFQKADIKLITTIYGKMAVSLAIAHRPDLILLDLNLPDIHGSEVLKLLLAEEKTKAIPIVIISADAMPRQLDRLLKAGAKRYLTKPLDVADFLKVIDLFIIG